MKLPKLFGRFLQITSVIFMPLALFFTAVGNNIKVNSSVFGTMLLLSCFSALVSADFLLCASLKINNILKRAVHFILAYLSFFIVFFAVPKKLSDLYTVIIMTLAFVVVYSIAGGVKIAICSLLSRKEMDKNYTSVYDNLNKNKK